MAHSHNWPKATVKFRGEQVEVEYYDHGYEPDTNAHVIDWDFGAGSPLNEANLTDAEEQSVYDQLLRISSERSD